MELGYKRIKVSQKKSYIIDLIKTYYRNCEVDYNYFDKDLEANGIIIKEDDNTIITLLFDFDDVVFKISVVRNKSDYGDYEQLFTAMLEKYGPPKLTGEEPYISRHWEWGVPIIKKGSNSIYGGTYSMHLIFERNVISVSYFNHALQHKFNLLKAKSRYGDF